MATNLLGVPNSNVFIPLAAATKRTKEVALTTTGTSSWSATFASGIAYADSLGNWWLSFNLSGTTSSTGSVTVTFAAPTAVTFKNTGDAVGISAICGGPTIAGGLADGNTATIVLTCATNQTRWRASGNVQLNAEPSWAAANMEGALPVDVYVPSCADGIQGLVNNLSGNTTGNPIKGRTDGGTVASGYVGQKLLGTINTGNLPVTTNQAIGTIVLDKGVYMLYGGAVLQVSGTTSAWASRSEPYIDLGINTANNALGDHLVRHVFVATDQNDSVVTPVVCKYIEVASDDTTYYLVGYILANNTGTFTVYNNSGFYAVRMA